METISQHKEFDLVISDFNMPEMNGAELLKRLRSQGYTLPLVLLSGYGFSLEDSLDIQPDALIAKPISIDHLQKVMNRVCQANSASAHHVSRS